MRTPDFDVAIIGGGPAGASAASYLAKAGAKCVVLERDKFPRAHVGESLVPSSTRVFRDLGFLETMEAAGFPRKYGAAWTTVSGEGVFAHDLDGTPMDCRVDLRFAEREQPGVDRPYTYHVDRAKFDLLLLRHAEKLGATVREGTAVSSVELEKGAPAVLRVRRAGRATRLTARMVVDASGRRTLLGSQLGLKRMDPAFDQFALHSWFEGYDRSAFPNPEYIHVHFLPLSNSWIWQIPITESVTSVGVVTQRANFSAARRSREAFFWDCAGGRPEIRANLERAKQLRPLKEEGDYSYAMSRFCGDGFVLLGDAARFVDPIFSTGVSIALNSARAAAPAILKALETGDFRRKSFAGFEATMRRGTQNWYDFITLYYRLNVLFTYFVRDPRYRLDVLKLLQGDVYDEDRPEILAKMRELVSAVERDPSHVWHAKLGELTADAFNPSLKTR